MICLPAYYFIARYATSEIKVHYLFYKFLNITFEAYLLHYLFQLQAPLSFVEWYLKYAWGHTHHNHITSLCTIFSMTPVYDFDPYHQGTHFTAEQTYSWYDFSVTEVTKE